MVREPLAPGSDGPLEEVQLVERLKAGDDAAYEQLVRENGGRLLGLARRLTGNEEDARDVLQEAFLSAFRAMDRFAGESRLSTWLHRIVVNTALMKLRSRRRRPEEALDPLLPTFASDGRSAERYSQWPDAERAIEQRETRERVRGGIERLPESHRTVLMLRDIEGLDTRETATMLGITENAVKIRLHRARQALRTILDEQMREQHV
jgi:RNA polymerase sigma-70 factor, ECF subfamily